MSDRVPCCVPFCNRTAPRPATATDRYEWVCGIHWQRIALVRRKAYARMRRRGFASDARLERVWHRLKCIAIEKAGGI